MEIQTLTRGEKAALASGKEITTDAQLAVCYLIAYDRNLNRITNFGSNVSDDVAVEIGLNMETFRRTVNKFELIIQDRHQDIEYVKSEHVYEKILKAHEKYADLKYHSILEMAKEAFTPEAKELGLKLKDAHVGKLKKYAQIKKTNDKNIQFKLLDLFNALKKAGIKAEKAKDMAINKISIEFNKTKTEILRVWNISQKF